MPIKLSISSTEPLSVAVDLLILGIQEGASIKEGILSELGKELAAGGSFGSIMGRNAFQRSRTDALKLLGDVMAIYKKA